MNEPINIVYGYGVYQPQYIATISYEPSAPLTGWRLCLGIALAVIGGLAIAAAAYYVGGWLLSHMKPADFGRLGGYFMLGFVMTMATSRSRKP